MIFDIVALVFVVVFSLWMAKRGGVKALMSLGGIILSIIVAMCVYPKLSGYVYQTQIPQSIETSVYNALSEHTDAEAFTALPDFVQNIVSVSSLEEGNEIYETVAAGVTEVIVNILVFVLALIITRLILFLLEWLLNSIMKLPVLRQLNRLVGFLCGVAISCVIVIVAVHVLGVISVEHESVAAFMRNSYAVTIAGNVSPF